jgi:hypothetical protein
MLEIVTTSAIAKPLISMKVQAGDFSGAVTSFQRKGPKRER